MPWPTIRWVSSSFRLPEPFLPSLVLPTRHPCRPHGGLGSCDASHSSIYLQRPLLHFHHILRTLAVSPIVYFGLLHVSSRPAHGRLVPFGPDNSLSLPTEPARLWGSGGPRRRPCPHHLGLYSALLLLVAVPSALHHLSMRLKGSAVRLSSRLVNRCRHDGGPDVCPPQHGLDDMSDSWPVLISYIFAIQRHLVVAPWRHPWLPFLVCHYLLSLPSHIVLFSWSLFDPHPPNICPLPSYQS